MKKNLTFIKSFMLIFAGIAGLGTLPYAFNFAKTLSINHSLWEGVLSIVFAFTAVIANAILGYSSFLSLKNKVSKKHLNSLIIVICLFSALPSACLSYFGYLNALPLSLNIMFSLVIVVVNAAINYRAISNLYLVIQSNRSKSSKKLAEAIINYLGFIVGIEVTIPFFIATYKGILTIQDSQFVALMIALLAWIPEAALFIHAAKTVFQKIHSNFKLSYLKKLSYFDYQIAFFSMLSASAFAQITYEFTEQSQELFNLGTIPFFIYLSMGMLALLVNACVNYVALDELINKKRARS